MGGGFFFFLSSCSFFLFSPLIVPSLQCEELFCGPESINIDILKENTEYDCVKPNAKYVKYFWRALEKMTLAQRKKFLKFVASRTRLPSSPSDWHMPFKIVVPQPKMRENPDAFLPYAQVFSPPLSSLSSSFFFLLVSLAPFSDLLLLFDSP